MKKDFCQAWTPPQELTGLLPRPIKKIGGKGSAAASYSRIAWRKFPLYGASALFGLVCVGLWRAPGATIETKWEQFTRTDMCGVVIFSVWIYVLLCVWWLSGYFQRRKLEWLLKWGKPAPAVVTELEYHGAFQEDKTRNIGWWCKFELHDDVGKLLKGNEIFSSKPGFSVHDVLTVLYGPRKRFFYDPRRPRNFILYPQDGYEVGGPEES